MKQNARKMFNTGKSNQNKKSRLETITSKVKDLRKQYNDYRLYVTVTGHSLGGALGLLTTIELTARFGKPGLFLTYRKEI